ncbi:MAG: V-type ATP synthase subunit E [Spirochaetales bacterium]|nr:V-type ATP synthase subunit E [Spirochaetales bacterium]
MDAQLKELIEKIKSDGVKTAGEEAAKIIAEAEKKAARIIADAERQAEDTRSKAASDAARSEASGKDALKQAGRNLLIDLRKEIEGLFNSLLEEEIRAGLSGDAVEKSIVKVLEKWSEKDGGDLVLLLPEKDLGELEKGLKGKLASRIKAGMEIKPFKDLEAGFRISTKDGSSFYDFSDEELTALYSRYLSPSLFNTVK